jgi:hypothetical protein
VNHGLDQLHAPGFKGGKMILVGDLSDKEHAVQVSGGFLICEGIQIERAIDQSV